MLTLISQINIFWLRMLCVVSFFFLQNSASVYRLFFFVLVFLSALMRIWTCSLSLAKSFMREALQGLAVICFVCKILHLFMDLSCNSPMWARAFFDFHFTVLGVGDTFSHFRLSRCEITCEITLMLPDPIPLSSAIWRDRSGKGTSQEGVRVNFPGLSLGPSSSSHVTVLGFSLEKPAVTILAVLPGQSQCHHSMKTWKPGFGRDCALQRVPGERRQAIVVNEIFVIRSIKIIKMNMHFQPRASFFVFVFWLSMCFLFLSFLSICMWTNILWRGSMLTSWYNMMAVLWTFTFIWWYKSINKLYRISICRMTTEWGVKWSF